MTRDTLRLPLARQRAGKRSRPDDSWLPASWKTKGLGLHSVFREFPNGARNWPRGACPAFSWPRESAGNPAGFCTAKGGLRVARGQIEARQPPPCRIRLDERAVVGSLPLCTHEGSSRCYGRG